MKQLDRTRKCRSDMAALDKRAAELHGVMKPVLLGVEKQPRSRFVGIRLIRADGREHRLRLRQKLEVRT